MLRESTDCNAGRGSAAMGVADFLRAAMVADGLSDPDARRRFWVVEKDDWCNFGRTDLAPNRWSTPSRGSAWRLPHTANGKIGLAA